MAMVTMTKASAVPIKGKLKIKGWVCLEDEAREKRMWLRSTFNGMAMMLARINWTRFWKRKIREMTLTLNPSARNSENW